MSKEKIVDQFITFLKIGDSNQAWQLFQNCEEAQQKNLIEGVAEELRNNQNRAIDSPSVVLILNRRLRENKNFNDFYDAWKPPVEGVQTAEKKRTYDYFRWPVRVINAQNSTDPNDIVSIAMIWGDKKDIEGKFQDEMKRVEKTEQLRQKQIEAVSEFNSTGNQFCVISSDDILGH